MGASLGTYHLLQEIVAALDRRFPEGNEIYQRLARLLEEAGELAKEINHHEGMGIKKVKHGEPSKENLVHELQDVLRATMGIARHYGVEKELEASIRDYYRKCQSKGYF